MKKSYIVRLDSNLFLGIERCFIKHDNNTNRTRLSKCMSLYSSYNTAQRHLQKFVDSQNFYAENHFTIVELK
jgi:hypothetical protein